MCLCSCAFLFNRLIKNHSFKTGEREGDGRDFRCYKGKTINSCFYH